MQSRTVQVDVSTYRRRYLSLPRMITHWHQADAVCEHATAGGRVLEIGPGAGHTSWLLRQWGMQVTTLDFDPQIKPDIVGDVTAIPCADASFDCVLAAEVLEHIPFAEFGKALAELRRVCRGHLVVTLPAPFVGLSALINLSGLDLLGVHLGLPFWMKHRYDGEHHWELGKRGYGIARVRRLIRAQGLKIIKDYRPAPSLYCYFFVMQAAG